MPDRQQDIRTSFHALRHSGQGRQRSQQERASQLAISEGELLAAHVGAASSILHVTRLRSDWPALMNALEMLGEVLAQTRNAACVHEKTGVYQNVSHGGEVGLVLGEEIDLRVFYRQWAHGFAVCDQIDDEERRSLQFFDAAGTALHKVFLTPHSNGVAWENLTTAFAADDQQAAMAVESVQDLTLERADAEIDVAAFRQVWAGLRDTHEFFNMLRRFEVSRTQGLRLAEARFVQAVELDSCRHVLEAAAREGVAVTVYVGNPGMMQIHTGLIHKVSMMGPWLNVLDPGFKLHLQCDAVASAWVVRKPSVDGLVTSLELFDADGETIALLFGERKPGRPELCEWRGLIDRLLLETETCVF